MAEQQLEQKKTKPAKARRAMARPGGVRLFRRVEVRLVRLGRDLGMYKADFGRLDVNRGTFEFLNNASAVVGGVEVKAAKITLHSDGNQVVAEGQVVVSENGVFMEADSMIGPPSLAGMKFGGTVVVSSDDKQIAESLLRSGKF